MSHLLLLIELLDKLKDLLRALKAVHVRHLKVHENELEHALVAVWRVTCVAILRLGSNDALEVKCNLFEGAFAAEGSVYTNLISVPGPYDLLRGK